MKKILKYPLLILKWTVISVVALIALMVFLVYLPPVQDFAVHTALDKINAGGTTHIEVKRARLSFPLRLSVDSMSMRTPGMAVDAASARGEIAFMPLLAGSVDVERLTLRKARVDIGTPDSAMYMRATLGQASLRDASIHLLSKQIDVGLLSGRNGRILLDMRPDTIAKPEKKSEPTLWAISLRKVELLGVYYRMSMEGTIASLQCALPAATLLNGRVDLGKSTVSLDSLTIDRPDIRYIAATSTDKVPEAKPAETDTAVSTPWLVTARGLRLRQGHAVYATEGARPAKGFDPAYIEAADIAIAIDSLRNRGTEISVPLRELAATLPLCGNLSLKATGTFAMDSTAMHADGFTITTPSSTIGLSAMMGLTDGNPPVSATLNASIANTDLRALAPAPAAEIVGMLPPYAPLLLTADIDGRMNSLRVNTLTAEIPRYISLSASGAIADYADFNRASGELIIKGKLTDGNYIKPRLLDAKMQRQVNIPPIALAGHVNLRDGTADGTLRATTGGGDVVLDAMWNNRATAYDIALDLDRFPIQTILPLSGLRDIDASATLSGHGLDPFATSTAAEAEMTLHNAVVKGQQLSDISLKASLADGNAHVEAASANRRADFSLQADGNIAGQTMDWTFATDVRNIDLRALGLTDSVADGAVALAGRASFTPAVASTRRKPGRHMRLEADVDVSHLYWHMPGDAINADSLRLNFATADSATTARLTNHDLTIDFSSPEPLDTITKRLGWTSLALDRDLKRRRLAIDTIQRAMPRFSLDMRAGADNILTNYLAGRDMSFADLKLHARNDSAFSLSTAILGLTSGKTEIDSLNVDMLQRGSYLLYSARMNNRPGTMDQFAHVEARGYINADRVSISLSQQNIAGETGYSLGMLAAIHDMTHLRIQFVPFHPVIGYKDWDINRDNFIDYDLATQHIDANLDLHNKVSSLQLFTEHNHADSTANDVVLRVKDIKLADWLAINPFAPPITGDLSADMKISWLKPDLNGSGTVSLHNFNYGKQKVGDFDLALDLTTNAAGTLRATTSLMVDGHKAITASGNLNDSTAANPFLLDFRMIHFPLSVVNPFLPAGTARLSGTLNGELDITGEMTAPVLNGNLSFDSTTVDVEMLGTPLRFASTPIPVENSVMRFNDFAINGVNSKPLTINGTVDLTHLSSPQLDLALKARDMQIVGSQKKRNSQAYGKAFIDLDALVRGNMSMLNVSADLNLLPSTNVTYVMADAATELKSRSNQDMVRFVNFADTASTAPADTIAAPSMMMNIDAKLTVSTGTTVTVELDPSGNSKVQLQSNGTVNFTQDYMGDQRMSGRINLTGGFVRYAVPLIGEKSFSFNQGSYIEFNGNMMNPVLHVSAYDDIRANVSDESGNSRVVNFNVLLRVDGTLDEMNVVFDLECPDDLTIANEIKSMSPEQRANQAMNLLLYGTYRSGGTQTITGGNVGTNALYSFLQSQLNTWAASAIKGVDISFGINQYDKTVDGANTSAMNYSYRVSKSLFDDRFKIVVGGNYTTDANADENFAQNLIADISFEYMLNKAGTMYVRLFRHTGYESILEGEITQTGVGFVYKKKISRLSDIFRRSREPQAQLPQGSVPPAAPAPAPSSTEKEALRPDTTESENESKPQQ